MQIPSEHDWSRGDAEAHLDMIRAAPRADLMGLACGYDWGAPPGPVLGWVMAQRGIDLGAALTVFLRGGPKRFNYMPKRDVPASHAAEARLLDNICLRINSGFYLPGAPLGGADRVRLAAWIAAQEADRAEGAQGRWALDEDILARVMGDDDRAEADRGDAAGSVAAGGAGGDMPIDALADIAGGGLADILRRTGARFLAALAPLVPRRAHRAAQSEETEAPAAPRP